MLVRGDQRQSVVRLATDNSDAGGGPIALAREPDFSIDSLTVQPSSRQIVCDRRSETLEPRVMQVLVVLGRRAGQVVTRDELVELCWGRPAVSEDAINRTLAKLRRVAAASGSFEVETIPRVGYRLTVKHGPAPEKPRVRNRGLATIAGVALLILLALAIGWYALGREGGESEPAVAVARFTALNSGADAQNYADSITAGLSDGLVKMGVQLRGATQPIRTAEHARAAGAALLVSGTVRREERKVRVIASINSSRTGEAILTRDFEAPLDQAADLPDHVAAALAGSVHTWVTAYSREPDPFVSDSILRLATSQRLDFVLRWNLARRLVQARPDSPSALTVFAKTTAYAIKDMPHHERPGAVAAARAAARRAAALAPHFGSSHWVEPCLLTPPSPDVLTVACERGLRKGMAVDPDAPQQASYFAQLLGQSGRWQEAEQLSERALAQAPLNPLVLRLRSLTLNMIHPRDRNNELPEIEARARRYWPGDALADPRYRSAVANGGMAEAAAILNDPASGSAIVGEEGRRIANLVFRAVETRSPQDVAAARSACIPAPTGWTPPNPIFATCLIGFSMVGDLDSVFRLADMGYEDVQCCSPQELEQQWLRIGGWYYPRWDLFGRAMAPVRADPRLIGLARRTGLLDYWKSGRPPDFCRYERVPVCALLPPDAGRKRPPPS